MKSALLKLEHGLNLVSLGIAGMALLVATVLDLLIMAASLVLLGFIA